jgi:HK97 family phage portal protein
LTDEQFRRLKEMIEEDFTGAVNSGKPMILEGGLDWKEISLSPKDMDFIEGKHSAARDIALAFGVPPQLLGISGDNTYSNLVEARTTLWEQTILPLAQNTIDHIGRWLLSYINKKLF